MLATFSKDKTSSQKRIILAFILVFLCAVIIICTIMYQVFSDNLSDNLHSRAIEVIDIIDYMAQTSGESPVLTKGIETLAANRDIKLIIVRINEPPVVIASNKASLIGLPSNDFFSNIENNQSFKFDPKTDQYTAVSSIWLENKFSNGNFTRALVGVVFDTYKTRIVLQEQILKTSFYLILTTIFAIGFLYYLTRKYIFKPLEVINSSLVKTTNNEFIPISSKYNDEIGVVANTLNNLFIELYASKKSLLDTTERYELALQGTEVGLFDWDIEHDTIYCSSSLKKILGIETNKLSPTMDWFGKLVHKDDEELANSALISHLKNDTKYDVEGRLKHKNGKYIWMRSRGQAIRDKSGKAIRMVGYYVDISKRKKHEIFMQSIYILISDSNIPLSIKLNKIIEETCDFLNLESGIISKIENNKYYTLHFHSNSFEYNSIDTQNILDLSNTLCEYTIKRNEIFSITDVSKSEYANHASHKLFNINSYIAFPLYMHGKIFGTINFFDRESKTQPFEEREKSFVRLISQLITNEMMRAQYIENLHETENKLENAVEELTNSNAELESFTYVASHDLQEPLRMITNFTGILKNNYSDQLDERAREYLNISSRSANQMRMLIKDLLEYAHASTENEKIESVNLNIILNHVYNNLEKQIKESNARIVFKNMPIVQANQASMISLMQNLISNGIKFQPEGNTPVITIDSSDYEENWIISVSDNGIGISNQYLNKIFEPFKRLHAKSEYNGTGIGLAVCNKIVQRLGGRLWIESDETTGSTFYFTIPKAISLTGKAA